MTKTLKKGEKVSWDSAQGQITGTVISKVTGTAHVKAHTAKASPADPQYKVKSDKTGATAIHKPDALSKK